ncbi:MAG: hypothetical protein AAB426_03890, partial [Myxococcota bacterium]
MWPVPHPRPALVVALLVGLATSTTAVAQSLDRPEGIGLKVGEGRLHASVQLETHYVYNPGYIAPDGSYVTGVLVTPSDAFVLLVRPGLDYNRPSPRLELSFAGDVDRHEYFGMRRSTSGGFSGTSGHATAAVVINKESWVSVRLRDALVRDDEPGNQTLYDRIKHTSNEAGAGVDIAPGGGALRLSLDYAFFFDTYDEQGILNNIQHRPALSVHWKFLPKTAAFFQAQGTLTSYSDAQNVG